MELGAMLDGSENGCRGPIEPKLFTYLRYDPQLTRKGLDEIRLKSVSPEDVLPMDSVDHIEDLQRVGRQYAKLNVDEKHFDGFI